MDMYKISLDIFYWGGIIVPNSPTPADCQAACNERETCAGFDFNTVENLCYMHTSANLKKESVSQQTVDHYRRIRCSDTQRK